MALRFVCQTRCNIRKNRVYKSPTGHVFADSTHRPYSINNRGRVSYRNLSPSPERNITLPNNFLPRRQLLSAYKYEEYESDNKETASKQPKYVNTPKVINQNLQPSKLTPTISTHLRQTPTYLPEAVRMNKVERLQQLATKQYETARKALNPPQDDESSRYYLEASRPRTQRPIPAFYSGYKKQISKFEVSERASQLQPRKIKPFGDMNILKSYGPSARYVNQATVVTNKKQGQPINTIKKSNSDTQQRAYCTANGNKKETPSIQILSDIDLCASNPEKGYEIGNSNSSEATKDDGQLTLYSQKKPTESNIHSTELTRNVPLRMYMPQLDRPKCILYYEYKNGKKTLCSKILGQRQFSNVRTHVFNEEAQTIKIKVGPKMMLQSGRDYDYSMREITPAANEKFVAPWLSWGDRVKLKQERIKNNKNGFHLRDMNNSSTNLPIGLPDNNNASNSTMRKSV